MKLLSMLANWTEEGRAPGNLCSLESLMDPASLSLLDSLAAVWAVVAAAAVPPPPLPCFGFFRRRCSWTAVCCFQAAAPFFRFTYHTDTHILDYFSFFFCFFAWHYFNLFLSVSYIRSSLLVMQRVFWLTGNHPDL